MEFSNRATMLMNLNFQNTSQNVLLDFETCYTSGELKKCFMRHVDKMEDGQELLDLRDEINWSEILRNK